MSPPLVRATLRPYQHEGVAWLLWVEDVGPGGVLADDMGLGKTLQCIAAMAAIFAVRSSFRALVVTTTSTVHNWAKEIAQFAPQLRVGVWAGKNRKPLTRAVFHGGLQVIVTSYDVALVDKELLTRQPAWDWLLLDEAQAIKNASSRRALLAHALPARRRFALTGTPIENGAADFHSIFSYAVPGLLGTLEMFQGAYGDALREGNQAVGARLRAVVAPYLLRRLKSDVAKDLPQKTDVVRHVTLPAQHAMIYAMIEAATQRALEQVDAFGNVTQEQRMAVFAALTRLRQVACDPRLLGIPYGAGGKLRALVDILTHAKARREKSLVFSSFATMVHLLEQDLEARGFGVSVLTGATEDRAAVLDGFATDESKDVFLITLKAGGAGLNITAASTVVHFDPWWNPAAEDQATDRAHRIGQHRAVSVYRLLAAGTIEQRVVERVGEKRDLAALLLGERTSGRDFAHSVRDLLQLIRKS